MANNMTFNDHKSLPSEKKSDKIFIDLVLFQKLVDEINIAIYIIDPLTSRFIYVNDKATTNLLYSREELLKLGVVDIVANIPDDFSWKSHVESLHKAGQELIEGQHRRGDGSTFSVQINTKFINIEGNEYIIAVARDITEQNGILEDNINRAQGLTTLLEVSKNYAKTLNLNEILQESVNGVTKLVGLETAAIYIMENEELYLQATTPPLPPQFPDELRKATIAEHPHVQK